MKRWMLVLMVLLCLLTTPAMADVAPNVTGKCSFTMEQISTKQREALTDHSNWTYAELRRGRKIEIDGKKRKLGGLHLKILDTSNQLEVHAFVNGKWTRVRKSVEHLSQWVPLPEGTLKVRLINKGKENARIASIAVYGEGSRPATVPEWRSINKADILLLVAHPDDELLWFGGLLPTYAAERKL